MATIHTHTITVQHKDGSFRQHHVMASDDASAIHQVPLDVAKERVVGIRRTQHANTDSKPITHAVSFKTNDLFGGDGHTVTHYVSVTRGSVEKEIEKMTKKNPQLGTPLGAHKIQEGERITYGELKQMLNEVSAAAMGKVADREFGQHDNSPPPAPRNERKSTYSAATADHAARRAHGIGATGGHVITHPVTGRSMALHRDEAGKMHPHTAATARKESMALVAKHGKPVTHTAFGPDGTHRKVTYHPDGAIHIEKVGE